MTDRTAAFDAIAGDYQRFRPTYPEAILRDLRLYAIVDCPPDIDLLAVDVGAGTGIATRQMAALFGAQWRVVGVEPGTGMLEEAQRSAAGALDFVEGRAEALPLASGVAALVVAAQAAQWFDRPQFYAEAARVLRIGGALALLQNNRDWKASPFLDRYEALLEQFSPGYDRRYRAFDYFRELNEAGYRDVHVFRTSWSRSIGRDDFLGMARSSSKVAAAIRSVGAARIEGAIGDLSDRYAVGDKLDIPYETELFVGRTPGSPAAALSSGQGAG